MILNPLKMLLAVIIYLLVAAASRRIPICEKEYINIGRVDDGMIMLYSLKHTRMCMYQFDPRRPEKGGQVLGLSPHSKNPFLIAKSMFKMITQVAAGKGLEMKKVEKPDAKK